MIDINQFSITIEEFLEKLYHQKKISYHTRRAYKSDLEQFERFLKARNNKQNYMSLNEALTNYISILLHKSAIEKRSIARKLSCFSTFIKFIQEKGIPIELEIKRPTFERKLPRAIHPKEIDFLLTIHPEALPTRFPHRDKAIIEILYATGITSSELVRITIADIDFQEKTIHIIGKKNKPRTVFFGTMAQKRLQKYLEFERPPSESSLEYLFLNHKHRALTTRSIQKICSMFKQFLKNDCVFTPHTLRHSFATHLLENGTEKKDLKELMGYETFVSTEQYAHIIPKSSKDFEI